MITLNKIQERLAITINQSGRTQKEMAGQLNIKQQTISKYINGIAMPALDTFANLCRILDEDPAYILNLKD